MQSFFLITILLITTNHNFLDILYRLYIHIYIKKKLSSIVFFSIVNSQFLNDCVSKPYYIPLYLFYPLHYLAPRKFRLIKLNYKKTNLYKQNL